MSAGDGSITGCWAPVRARSIRRPVQFLAAGSAIRWFGLSAYVPYALIYLNRDLRLPYPEAGALLAVPSLVGLAAPLVGGGLADRFGRRRILVTSLGLESLGLVILALGALTAVLSIVLAGLVFTRVFGTLGNPAVSSYVTDLTEPVGRAESQAWMRTALNLGFTGGTFAGGVSLALLTFAELAGMSALLTAVGVAFTVFLVPRDPYDSKLSAQNDPRRVWRPGRLEVHSSLSAATELLVAPLRALGRNRALLLVWAAACATWTLNQQISYAVPAYAHSGLGLSFVTVGSLLAVNAGIVVVAQVPLTRLLRGRSMAVLGVLGAGAYALAFVALGLEGTVRVQFTLGLVAAIIVLTLGECLVFYPTSTLSMNLAPEASRGSYAGAMNMSAGVGAVLAPGLAGVALGGSAGPLQAWAILALPALPAALLLCRVRPKVSAEVDRC